MESAPITIFIQPSDRSPILSFRDDLEAGLLIMDPCQKSKLGEDPFGGIISSVLKGTGIPLVLSP